MKDRLAVPGQTTKSIHTLLDWGVGRQIAVQSEGVRTPVEFAEALEQADRGGRGETRFAHEEDAKFIRFKLFILRVRARQSLKSNLANPGRERPSGRRQECERIN